MVPDIRFPVFNSPCDPEAQPSLPSHPCVPRTTKSKSFLGVRHLSSPGRCRVLPVPRAPRGTQYHSGGRGAFALHCCVSLEWTEAGALPLFSHCLARGR